MQIKESMSEKKPRSVGTPSEFIGWAAQFKSGEHLFRGLSKDNYEIEASAYRRIETNKIPARLLKANEELIEKARVRGHDQLNGQRLTDLELLAQLQHYGAATCLIDFSRNALVALWFACQQSSNGEANGKVVAVRSDDPARFKTVTSDIIENKIKCFFKPIDYRVDARYPLYQWEPKYQNNRIIAQNSVFVFGGAELETEDECVITLGSKQDILESLDRLFGITEASMYPDFDGFARLHAHDKLYNEPDARSYLRRGIEAHQRGNLDDAIAYYTEVIKLDPPNTSIVVIAYHNRGGAFYESGNYDRAEEDYDKALDLDPNNAETYYSRAAVHERKDNYERAITDLYKTIELNPNHVNAYSSRGVVFGLRDDYERAIVDCNRAIELDPNSSFAYSSRGNVHTLTGDNEHAIADCNRAIELDPRNFNAYDVRGVVFYRLGDYENAIEDYTKAIDLESSKVGVYYNRGEARLHLRQWDEARNDLRTAREKGYDIVTAFSKEHGSVDEFQQNTGITLPEDIAQMLTPVEDS